jgi:hypothetical protein
MIRSSGVVALLALFSTISTAQPQKFEGTWEARFKSNIFMILKLQAGEPVSGTLSGGTIRVNEEGDLVDASGGGDEFPISKARIDGNKLSFDWKDSGDETLRLEMRLTGEGEAQLQFLNLPEGAKMKPLTLKRK